ncbi:MAG: hypothetical protein QM709_02930 [Spongiibacteraceae bacterium]
MKSENVTRKSLEQLRRESGKTSWASLISQESKEQLAIENQKRQPEKP